MSRLVSLFRTARSFLVAVGDHALFSHAAATAFYLFFSIPPSVLALAALFGFLPIEAVAHWLLIDSIELVRKGLLEIGQPGAAEGIAFTLRSLTEPLWQRVQELGEDGILHEVQRYLDASMPSQAAQSLGKVMRDVLGASQPALLTVGFVGVLWSASGVTRQLGQAMNVIYEVKKPTFLVRNISSLLLTVLLLAVVSITIGFMPVIAGLVEGLSHFFGWRSAALTIWKFAHWGLVAWLVYAGLMTFYRRCVNVKLKAGHVRPGVLLTMALWAAIGFGVKEWGEFGYGRYNVTYGALAAVILILFWCYLMSVSLLLGANLIRIMPA